MKDRQDCLNQAQKSQFDLLVIGAGLSGAGIAQIASIAGLKVLLIDRSDFGGGRSANRSQIFESAGILLDRSEPELNKQIRHEKELVRKLAPHMVKECNLLMPLFAGNKIFNLKASLGLSLQEVLTRPANDKSGFSLMGKSDLAAAAPFLNQEQIAGGLVFRECLTDSSRFVLELIKSGQAHGAVVLNYAEATAIEFESTETAKVLIRDRNSGKDFSVICKSVINACGKDSTELLAAAGLKPAADLRLKRRSYFVLPHSALETNIALILPESLNSFLLLCPWQHSLLLGIVRAGKRSETENISLDQDNPEDELRRIFKTLKNHIDAGTLKRIEMRGRLQEEYLQQTAGMSHDGLFVSGNRLLSIYDTDFTNYRKRAVKALELLQEVFPDIWKIADELSRNCMLGGWESRNDFLSRSVLIENKAKRLLLSPASIEHLLAAYGCEAEHIVDLIEKRPELKQKIIADFPALQAELYYAAINEMSMSLQDFLYRRTRLALLNPRQCLQKAPSLATELAKVTGWDQRRIKAELEALQSALFADESMEHAET